MFKTIAANADTHSDSPRCLILDDTDFVKTSYRTEHVGFIWSHMAHRTVLGFKGLFLGYWDSKSFFALDFSMHKERGKWHVLVTTNTRLGIIKVYQTYLLDKMDCGSFF